MKQWWDAIQQTSWWTTGGNWARAAKILGTYLSMECINEDQIRWQPNDGDPVRFDLRGRLEGNNRTRILAAAGRWDYEIDVHEDGNP